ncbi:beta-lactamase domain protein [Rubellimicrobium mesophilum DSM 19309]|uniref:Beta-lactamase domain protein n=1 Tax=Rubellimicrobium mesophilum DSM 19309 TaxID=442562 RepID=A0A017HIR2_9RHOB|nr:MBL fold metallo-hydrolase RNA specificity domain-containing protein [Rubellimicrobium mesophilum]EYD74023.1 beta-lactamase domain protein [Rubellimicrobium mesophilum DSM 19309]
MTPIATDHSAFDAAMLLIEAEGTRILYTGDFRRHGRKAALVDRLMAGPPKGIAALVTEGTNLGQDKPVESEGALEDKFVDLFRRTKGRVFVEWSGQNIDRTVTLTRAAMRTGRILAIDLYTADVLERISEGTRLPRAGHPALKVVITGRLAERYRANGRGEFVARMARHGISAARLATGRHVVMLRGALIPDYAWKGVSPTAEDAYAHSTWRGYLARDSRALDWCRAGGAELAYLHTSGHASAADLRAFAAAVRPGIVVPVHGANWDSEAEGFGPVRRLADGEPLVIG